MSVVDPTPDQQAQRDKTDEQLLEEIELDRNLAGALRIVFGSGIGPEEWCEEEGIELEALKAYASTVQRRVEASETLTAFGAACQAFQMGVVARKLQDRDSLRQLAELKAAIAELRDGKLGYDDFIGLVVAAQE